MDDVNTFFSTARFKVKLTSGEIEYIIPNKLQVGRGAELVKFDWKLSSGFWLSNNNLLLK